MRAGLRAGAALGALLACTAALAEPPACAAADQGGIPSFFGRRPTLVATGARETGTQGTPDETRWSATLLVPRCEAGAWSLSAARRERADTAAHEIGAAYLRPLGRTVTVGLRASYGPQGTLLPASTAGVHAAWQFAPGWVAGASLDRRRFTDDTVIVQALSVDRYVGVMRFGAGVSAARLNAADARTVGYLEASRGDADRHATVRVFTGDEPEALRIGVQTRPVRGVVLIGRQPIAAGWGLVGSLAVLDRGEFGVRRSAEIGLVHRF